MWEDGVVMLHQPLQAGKEGKGNHGYEKGTEIVNKVLRRSESNS